MKNTAFIALGANLKRNKDLSLQENIQTALKYFPDSWYKYNKNIKLL